MCRIHNKESRNFKLLRSKELHIKLFLYSYHSRGCKYISQCCQLLLSGQAVVRGLIAHILLIYISVHMIDFSISQNQTHIYWNRPEIHSYYCIA
jgi:hypothetical protein